jgi:hypothetical protein
MASDPTANAGATSANAGTTTTPARSGGRQKWTPPVLIIDDTTGEVTVPQELIEGPNKTQPNGVHAAALIKALQDLAGRHNSALERIAALEATQQETEATAQAQQKRQTALDSRLLLAGTAFELLAYLHSMQDKPFESATTSDGEAFTQTVRFEVGPLQFRFNAVLTSNHPSKAELFVGSTADAPVQVVPVQVSLDRSMLPDTSGVATIVAVQQYITTPELFVGANASQDRLPTTQLNDIYESPDAVRNFVYRRQAGMATVRSKRIYTHREGSGARSDNDHRGQNRPGFTLGDAFRRQRSGETGHEEEPHGSPEEC